MQNVTEFQKKLDTITQTIGGHEVRNLKYMKVRHMEYIVGDLRKQGNKKWFQYEVWDMQGKYWHNEKDCNINFKPKPNRP